MITAFYIVGGAALAAALVLFITWKVLTYQARKGGAKNGVGSKTRRKVREELRLGYRYDSDTGSVFVHGNTVWTGVRLPVRNSWAATLADVDAAAAQATRALTDVSRSNQTVKVQYRLTHQLFDVDKWRDQKLSPLASWNPTALYRSYIELQAEYLRFRKQPQPVSYLLVQIAQLTQTGLERFQERMDAFLTGEADDMVPPDLAAEWQAQSDRVMRAINGSLPGAAPITRTDRMWLIRKPLTGCYDPQLDDFPKAKPWGPGQYAMWIDFKGENLRDSIRADLRNADVHIADRSESDELTSYSACLSVIDWPADIDAATGTDWIQQLASAGIEVSMRMELIPAAKWREELTRINNGINSEAKEIDKSNQQPSSQFEDDQARAALALEESRVNKRQPGMRWQMILQVTAPTQAELQRRIDAVIALGKNSLGEVVFVHPSRYQWRMLQSMLPGTGPSLDSIVGATPYVRWGTPAVFGLGLPTAGTVIGDQVENSGRGLTGWVGDFVGWAGPDENVPLFFSPHSGIASNVGAGVLFLGQSGGGKSTAALLKFFQDSESGVSVRVLDPKQDFAQACYYLSFGNQVNDPDFTRDAKRGTLGTPQSQFQPVNATFWRDTRIIDVLESAPGCLDPWAISSDIHDGTLLANEMLASFLGPAMSARFSDFIRDAVDRLTKMHSDRGTKPSLWEVADLLNADAAAAPSSSLNDETKRAISGAAREVSALRHTPIARLAFAERPTPLNLGDDGVRRLVMTLRGLPLPSSDRVDDPATWTESERYGATIMYVLCRLNTTMLDNSPTRHPVTGAHGLTRPRELIVDESYIVSGTDTGKALLRAGLAQGRAYNSVVALIDQNASRMASIESDHSHGEVGTNTVQAVFGFLQRSRADAAKVAPLLTDTNTDEVAQALLPVGNGGTLETGRCLFRDKSSRLAPVRVDVMFRELANAFETGPSTRQKAQSRPISADIADWSFLDFDLLDDDTENPTPDDESWMDTTEASLDSVPTPAGG